MLKFNDNMNHSLATIGLSMWRAFFMHSGNAMALL